MTTWALRKINNGRNQRLIVAWIIAIAVVVSPSQWASASKTQPVVSTVPANRVIAGDWQGTLEFPGAGKFRLLLRIARAPDGKLSALNYSIDQGPQPMQTSEVTLNGSSFHFAIPALGGSYEGQLSADGNAIMGTWKQPAPLTLNFVRASKGNAWEIPKPEPSPKPMASDADPSFAVATIKPSSPDTSEKYFRVIGRRFTTHHATLAELIEVAYGIHSKQLIGAPAWVHEERFDLVGAPDGEGEPNGSQWTTMLQKLLASRFSLTLHHEQKEISVYILSVMKSGPKNLTESANSNPLPSLEFRPSSEGITLPAKNASIEQFATMMQASVLDRPILDRTGISGRFDFQLTFAPNDSQFGGHPPYQPAQRDTASSAPDLFDAMQQQLGLKLSAEKAPVDVLVIDHVEKPSEN